MKTVANLDIDLVTYFAMNLQGVTEGNVHLGNPVGVISCGQGRGDLVAVITTRRQFCRVTRKRDRHLPGIVMGQGSDGARQTVRVVDLRNPPARSPLVVSLPAARGDEGPVRGSLREQRG